MSSAQLTPGPLVRANRYRNLATQAADSIAKYNAKAERHAEQGDAHFAIEYQQLANEASTRAEIYLILAAFAERNS